MNISIGKSNLGKNDITPSFPIKLLALVPLTLVIWAAISIAIAACVVVAALVPFVVLFGKWTVKK